MNEEQIIRTYYLTGENVYRTARALHLPANELIELFRTKEFRGKLEAYRLNGRRTP